MIITHSAGCSLIYIIIRLVEPAYQVNVHVSAHRLLANLPFVSIPQPWYLC